MKLTILGSGSYQPELNRHSSSHLIQIKKQNIVFDFGRGALDQLLKIDLAYYDIDAIFISHTHPDHFSELGSFLHIALAEPAGNKLRKKEVTLYGPPGFREKMRYFYRALDLADFQPKHKVIIKEIAPGQTITKKNWKISSFQVRHSKSLCCLAYRLTSGDKIFAYSGDSGECPGLRQAVKKAHVALMESSWVKTILSMHLSAAQAGKIAQEARVKKLILTHASPDYWRNYDIAKEAKKYFKGPIMVARDLMNIKI